MTAPRPSWRREGARLASGRPLPLSRVLGEGRPRVEGLPVVRGRPAEMGSWSEVCCTRPTGRRAGGWRKVPAVEGTGGPSKAQVD